MEYERHCVWSVLLRVVHWLLALSTFTLLITGFYIHYPWTNSMLEGTGKFPVATMRAIHFHAGFYFTAAMLARYYLLVFGNKFERLWDFFPLTPTNIKKIPGIIANYLYITDRHERHLGHNPWAGIFFCITFVLAAFQILSGFCMLYPESSIWQSLGLNILGTQQEIRFFHYLTTWYFIIFTLAHLYMVTWNDLKTKEGLISSITTGCKYAPKE